MGFFDMKWRLVACRNQAGYTQAEIGKMVGVTEKTIIDWEAGRTAPNMDRAQKLSEIYNIPLAYIDFTKEGNSTPLKDREQDSGVTL